MITVIQSPAAEPVSAADAITQTHLRTEPDIDADLVDLYIASARQAAENETRRAFVTQTFRLSLERFPRCDRHIELPRPPLQSVTAVRYYDPAGVLQTLDAAAYYEIGAEPAPVLTVAPMPGKILLRPHESWPATECRPDAVQIEYVAGYGDPEAVPAGIRHAVLVHASDSYAHRETMVVGTVSSTLSRPVAALLSPYLVPDGNPSR